MTEPSIASAAGRTDQDSIRRIAQAAAGAAGKKTKGQIEKALLETARAFTSLLSQTFQAVAWNSNVLYAEDDFHTLYARTHELTRGFTRVDADAISQTLREVPSSILTLRLIAALSLDEVSALLKADFGIEVSKDLLREFELGRDVGDTDTKKWQAACPALGRILADSVGGSLLELPAVVDKNKFKDRKSKPDTKQGWESVRDLANRGVDYWVLLY